MSLLSLDSIQWTLHSSNHVVSARALFRMHPFIRLLGSAVLIANAREADQLRQEQANTMDKMTRDARQEREQLQNQVTATLHERCVPGPFFNICKRRTCTGGVYRTDLTGFTCACNPHFQKRRRCALSRSAGG